MTAVTIVSPFAPVSAVNEYAHERRWPGSQRDIRSNQSAGSKTDFRICSRLHDLVPCLRATFAGGSEATCISRTSGSVACNFSRVIDGESGEGAGVQSWVDQSAEARAGGPVVRCKSHAATRDSPALLHPNNTWPLLPAFCSRCSIGNLDRRPPISSCRSACLCLIAVCRLRLFLSLCRVADAASISDSRSMRTSAILCPTLPGLSCISVPF